jgi:hypothetical protein
VVRKNFYPGIFLERKTFYVCAIKFCPLWQKGNTV